MRAYSNETEEPPLPRCSKEVSELLPRQSAECCLVNLKKSVQHYCSRWLNYAGRSLSFFPQEQCFNSVPASYWNQTPDYDLSLLGFKPADNIFHATFMVTLNGTVIIYISLQYSHASESFMSWLHLNYLYLKPLYSPAPMMWILFEIIFRGRTPLRIKNKVSC